MRKISTIVLIGSFALTAFIAFAAVEYLTGAPGHEVFSSWWTHAEGIEKGAVIFFGLGLVAFTLLFSTWAFAWLQIMWGKPVSYAYLGPALLSDKDFYYDINDPERARLTISKRSGGYDHNPSSAIDSLLIVHTMLRYGKHPEEAERAFAHGVRAQSMLVLFQYIALVFGAIALGQVMHRYIEVASFPVDPERIVVLGLWVVLPLAALQLVGLISGHSALVRKTTGIQPGEFSRTAVIGLKPGDRLQATLVDKGREKSSSGNKPFIGYYRVEWKDRQGLVLSAVFAFRATRKTRQDIKDLDQLAERQDLVECVVSDEFTLRPANMASRGDVDWI